MFQNPYADLYNIFVAAPGQQQGAVGTNASSMLQQLMQNNLMQNQDFWGQVQAARGASAPLQSAFMPAQQAKPAAAPSGGDSSSGFGDMLSTVGTIASFFL